MDSNSDREGHSLLRRADNALGQALPLWAARFFGFIEQGFHCSVQGVEIIGDNVFHDGCVDVEVFVGQEIAHGADLPPGDLGPLASYTLR